PSIGRKVTLTTFGCRHAEVALSPEPEEG
nr:hypothetical protein [Tanacetum cinerariifolium]